jgi:hypothetical protein
MIKLSVRFDLSLTQKQGALHLDEAARRHRRDTAIVDGIIGTAATGTKAPTKISAPPTISTAIVAQPKKCASGVPIACRIAINPSAPRESLA